MQDFHPFDEQKAKLGQLLFYDPILSGNLNISCATCHHHDLASADGLALGIGEGGIGIGKERMSGEGDNKIKKRIPRNAPGLWNLGAREFTHFFYDGRVSEDNSYGNQFNTPAEEWLPQGLDNLLAVQAIFPLVSQFEMAGNPKENEVAGAIHDRIDNAWPILVKRIVGNLEYVHLFQNAFADVTDAQDITIAHIGNAIGDFINSEWRSFNSPYDRWVAGDKNALDETQQQGAALFFGKANCDSCHSGMLFTDHQFYALALPQFGPGRTRRYDPYARDVGRMVESDLLQDAYRFRTPSLRNVELTAPYGHNGAYRTIEGIVRHHLAPKESLMKWQPSDVELPDVFWLAQADFIVQEDRLEQQRLSRHIDIKPQQLNDEEITALVSFLAALTEMDNVNGRLGKPTRVPSGLEID